MVSNDHVVRPAATAAPEVGAALWMLDDTRARTLRAVDGVAPSEVDAIPIGGGNTIGALLYHIAAVELGWLYNDIREESPPDWAQQLLPHRVREENGRLSSLRGISLDEHLERMSTVRRHLHENLASLSAEDYRRRRDVPDGGGSPEWILHHLREHEAEHRGQIQEIRTVLSQGR